ncbi:MAG: hypothetical protein VX000_11820, partial [Myxococcota bacterium]|nr:hypothetical protein [Myxococcota bacterium]
VEAVLADHVTVSPVVSRGGAANGGLPLVTVDGFQVSVDDADALMAALEATATTLRTSPGAGRSARQGSEYRLRHYIALPVEWDPTPPPVECDISVAPQTSRVGQTLTIRGMVANAPDGAELVLRDSVGGAMDAALNDDGSFTATMTPAGARSGMVSFTLRSGGEDLCVDSAGYVVRPARVESVVKKQTPAWPRQVSIEPGFHRYAGGNHGQLGVTAGGNARFAGRLSVGEGLGLGIGPRFTAASKGDITVEFSGQGLVGLDSYLGAYAEAGTVLAVHGTVGPFVQTGLGRGTQYGRYGYFALGLGIYVPPRRQ